MTSHTLPLLLAILATNWGDAGVTAAPCENFIATPDSKYCLTSRGASIPETTAPMGDEIVPWDSESVFDDGDVLPVDTHYYEEDVTTDHISQP